MDAITPSNYLFLSNSLMDQVFSNLSEAVTSTRADTDQTTAVPRLSSLIPRARDVSLRPYYCRERRRDVTGEVRKVLPPIEKGRRTCGELPKLRSG